MLKSLYSLMDFLGIFTKNIITPDLAYTLFSGSWYHGITVLLQGLILSGCRKILCFTGGYGEVLSVRVKLMMKRPDWITASS